jgi:putative hydrolase of HD superfamily
MVHLSKQLTFIKHIDKLKKVTRKSYLLDNSRLENSAEHSWHIALMVLLLAQYSKKRVNPLRCVKMALVHDIPEIIAGDALIYSAKAHKGYIGRELTAAKKLFGQLPPRQAREYLSLWKEVETGNTPDARFVRAIDRLEPLLCNYATKGRSWRQHGVRSSQVRSLNLPRMETVPEIGVFVDKLISKSVRKGFLKK